jgi:uncharacterized pyridoxal phosphate-dependent enzyme
MDIYTKLGVKKVINASFALTRLGGSRLSPRVMEAMKEANESYVYMWDLIKRGGEIIAEKLGAEAAWITSGAFNALVLSAATCMAGADSDKMRLLPDTAGMKNEIIIQRANRLLVYDRAMEVAGGKFVFVGDETYGCTPQHIENAINENTAAIHQMVAGTPRRGVVSIEDTVKVAHKHGVPVILDVSGMTYPMEGLTKYAAMGVDLTCYGGKYVGGPNSTGFVVGRRDLIDALALHSFIGAEAGPKEQGGFYRSIGRGYKLDRQEVIALLVAFQEWHEIDHQKQRIEPAWKKARYIEEQIKGLPGLKDVRIEYTPRSGEGISYHTCGLSLYFDGRSEDDVYNLVHALRVDDPEVWVRYLRRGNSFVINTINLKDGEEKIIAERFKKVFG